MNARYILHFESGGVRNAKSSRWAYWLLPKRVLTNCATCRAQIGGRGAPQVRISAQLLSFTFRVCWQIRHGAGALPLPDRQQRQQNGSDNTHSHGATDRGPDNEAGVGAPAVCTQERTQMQQDEMMAWMLKASASFLASLLMFERSG